ncbi:MAG: hypothetical protein AAFX93_19570, partial [Verrucomicrobiota bacterium]
MSEQTRACPDVAQYLDGDMELTAVGAIMHLAKVQHQVVKLKESNRELERENAELEKKVDIAKEAIAQLSDE